MYVCKDYNEELKETFSIDIQGDLPTTHPTHFCQACKGAVYNYQQRGVTLQKPVSWKPHSDTCDTCSRAAAMRTGGRPTRDCGRPAACSRRSIISHLKKVSLPSFHPETSEHAPLSFTAPPHYGVSLDDITCPICLSIPNQPVELTDCAALVCSSCLTSWLFECDDNLPCPCCHRNLTDTNDIRRVPSVVQQLLEGILVSCTCGETISNRDYAKHTTGGHCSNDEGRRVTMIDHVLAQPINSPLTPIEIELQTTLARRSLATSPEENVIQMKTRGQVSETG